jgi:hypothetical protein
MCLFTAVYEVPTKAYALQYPYWMCSGHRGTGEIFLLVNLLRFYTVIIIPPMSHTDHHPLGLT